MGAHCGPSIAVTLNENLDYFGQTVNIAARVQSFADAGEICLTEALYAASGVRQLLARHDVEELDAPLRGVGFAKLLNQTFWSNCASDIFAAPSWHRQPDPKHSSKYFKHRGDLREGGLPPSAVNVSDWPIAPFPGCSQ
jgi:hypothetical protein